MRAPGEDRTLLLVEDSADDVLFFRRAWKRAGMGGFQHVDDGERAVAYLEGRGDYGDRARCPMPSLVVLDLKLPRRPGLEVLEWIRNAPRFRHLPVAILTSSMEPADVARAHALGVVAYHVKPADARELEAIVRSIAEALDAGESPEGEADGAGPMESQNSGRPR